METQVEKVRLPFTPSIELGPDCLCPPVCFQCPPPFCLPCGPGPGSNEQTDSANIPAPRQCGPFIMLNTPTERKTVLLPMYSDRGKRLQRDVCEERKSADCCVKVHHHHHIADNGVQDCCEKNHHHHHHAGEMEECRKACTKKGLNSAECCDQAHHHHHRGDNDELDCCEKGHHHHHHAGEMEECRKYCAKKGQRKEGKSANCCTEMHHHHHVNEEGETDCCEEFHHHHHHQGDEKKCKKQKHSEQGGQRRRAVRSAVPGTGRSNSRELRASKLLIGCDCEKRNGLQDDCQRSLCQGSQDCKSVPPTCVPSAYSNGKHLIARMDKALAKILAAKRQATRLAIA